MNTRELLKELNIEEGFVLSSALDDAPEEIVDESEQSIISLPEGVKEQSVRKTAEDLSSKAEPMIDKTDAEPAIKVNKPPRDRKARVKRLKKIIVATIVVLILVPNILSVYMMGKVASMTKHIRDLDDALNILYEEVSAQAAQHVGVAEAVPVDDQDNFSASVSEVEEVVTPEVLVLDKNETLSAEDSAEETVPVYEWPYENKRIIYLTFDDGPSGNTDAILDILANYNIKATFFMNGFEGYDKQYARIAAEGHSVGMHSFDHVFRNVYFDLDAFTADYEKIHDFIQEKTGIDSKLYRFPGGSSNNVSRMDMKDAIQYLHENGIIYFDWNISSYDASSPMLTADEIAKKVLDQIDHSSYTTNVILMHDATVKTSTVEALPIIIEQLLMRDDIVFLPITEDTPEVVHVRYE